MTLSNNQTTKDFNSNLFQCCDNKICFAVFMSDQRLNSNTKINNIGDNNIQSQSMNNIAIQTQNNKLNTNNFNGNSNVLGNNKLNKNNNNFNSNMVINNNNSNNMNNMNNFNQIQNNFNQFQNTMIGKLSLRLFFFSHHTSSS